MKKAELIKSLEKFKDDQEVTISIDPVTNNQDGTVRLFGHAYEVMDHLGEPTLLVEADYNEDGVEWLKSEGVVQ